MSDQGPTEQFGEALRAALLAGSFPNPTREGCPQPDLLKKMAGKRRTLPVGDPVHVHVMQCSPCYQQLEGYRAQFRRRSTVAVAAAAIVVLAAGIGIYQVWPTLLNSNRPELNRVVDLRPFTVERSDRPANAIPPPVRLPPSPVQTIFYMPVGFEPGPCEIRILDSELKTRSSASGNAQLEDFQTVIHTRLDLDGLAPGRYTLMMRHPGADWRQFPLLIEPAAK
ncbi:MAG: hypothetical protein JO307_15660 [Bryobacterales bacterium]|nr:hypothetical protein [Bryobacterales bacterium]